MMNFSRFFTILCLLGAGTTRNICDATTTGKNAARGSARNEFVRAMDQALGRKKNDEILRHRLKELAIPANSHPGYMRSHQQQNPDGKRQLEEYQDYAIDLTEYALKYIGCSNIRTWSDDLAAENNKNRGTDSVLQMDQFVVLRLCPRDSCSNYNQYGCLQNFGDYLIPMEIYLQTMAETYFTQYEEYCETCYECMSDMNNNNNYNNDDGGNNNGDDGNYYNNNYNNDDGGNYYSNNYNNGDDGNYYNNNYNNNDDGNYNNGGRRLNDDAYSYYNNYGADDAAADDAAGGDDYYAQNNYNGNQNQAGNCQYYAACTNYRSACQEYTNLGFDLEDYFECAEFKMGNSGGYLGPHCASDGKTISMGIFNDENCNEFSADISEISSYMAVQEDELEAYYADKCISCLASDGFTLEAGANDDDAYNAVSEICGSLYGESAKCNKHMGNSGDYASANQESQENAVCNFIENLLTNSYDEYGEIILQEIGWKTYIPNMETIRKISNLQKFLLSVSILSSIGMYLYAMYLYREIKRRRDTWFPRRKKGYSSNYPGVDPVSLDGRMNSGIIQGRSGSSGRFEMKNGGVMS